MQFETSREKPNWALLGAVRFVAALIVALFHTSGLLADPSADYFAALGATACVQVFLVISGFSIAASWERESRGFFRRRFWRIVPLYYAGLLMSQLPFVIHGPIIPIDFTGGLVQQTPLQTLLHFLWLQPLLVNFPEGNGSLWTLPIEASFYALTPLMARFGTRGVLALVAGSVAWNFYSPELMSKSVTGVNLAAFIWLYWAFAAGWLFHAHQQDLRARTLLVLFSVGVISFCHKEVEIYATPVAAVLLAIVAFNDKIALPAFYSKAFEYLGDLSFPLYVVHFPLGAVVAGFYLDVSAVHLLPAALVAAVLLLHCVDRPLRKLGRSRVNSPRLVPAQIN